MRQARRLYLLRHAKSSWIDPDLADHDRPLSSRGRQALALIAAYMREIAIEPDLILCSSAIRARETLDRVSPGGIALIEHRLYGAGTEDLLARLRALPPHVRSVMVIGHDPALRALVLQLAGRERAGRPATAEGLEQIRHKLPTGALVTLELESQWATLEPGCAELVDYVRPKLLGQRPDPRSDRDDTA